MDGTGLDRSLTPSPGQVTLSEAGQDHGDQLALVLRSLSQLDGSESSRTYGGGEGGHQGERWTAVKG